MDVRSLRDELTCPKADLPHSLSLCCKSLSQSIPQRITSLNTIFPERVTGFFQLERLHSLTSLTSDGLFAQTQYHESEEYVPRFRTPPTPPQSNSFRSFLLSLRGLQSLSKLTVLDLSGSESLIKANSSFVNVLSRLTSLTHLNLNNFARDPGRNPTVDVMQSVSHLTRLRVLLLHIPTFDGPFQQVEADVSMISSLSLLEDLVLPHCKITMIQLKNFSKLRRLAVSSFHAARFLATLASYNPVPGIEFSQEILKNLPFLSIFAWDRVESSSLLGVAVRTALKSGNLSVVHWMLEHKDLQPSFHPNTVYDETCPPPLANCARSVDRGLHICELLINYGADPNLNSLRSGGANTFQTESPLSIATENYNAPAVKLLLARGAAPSKTSLLHLSSTEAIALQLDHLGSSITTIFPTREELSLFVSKAQAAAARSHDEALERALSMIVEQVELGQLQPQI